MSKAKRKDMARALFGSMRGQYIVSQALFYAIETMRTVQPEVYQERSNIEDMEMLREELFNYFHRLPPEVEEQIGTAQGRREFEARLKEKGYEPILDPLSILDNARNSVRQKNDEAEAREREERGETPG